MKKQVLFLSCLLLLIPAFLSASDSIQRAVQPWWTENTVAKLAEIRRSRINPEVWSDAEKTRRTFEVSGNRGNFKGLGRVRVLDLFSQAGLFHYADPAKFRGGLYVTFEVLEPTEAVLRSSSGSGFWMFRNYDAFQLTPIYSSEKWDVTRKGIFEMEVPFFNWGNYAGPGMAKGVHEYATHEVFQIYDAKTGVWFDYCNHSEETSHIDKRLNLGAIPQVVEDTRFTVANLNSYRLSLGEFATDWTVGGYVGVRIQVKDADDEIFDLPAAEVEARVIGNGEHEISQIALKPVREYAPSQTKWGFEGKIPNDFFQPERITISARVRVLGPDGLLRIEELEKEFDKKETPALKRNLWLNTPLRQELRTKDGRLKETRFLTAHEHTAYWKNAESASWLVESIKRANANMLFVSVHNNGRAWVPTTNVFPVESAAKRVFEKDRFDGFGYLAEQCHKEGIELIPWICFASGAYVTPDGSFCPNTVLANHPDWAQRNMDGKPGNTSTDHGVVCTHRPEYHELMIRYVLELVRRYQVEGICLDFIRTVQPCFCEYCRREDRERTGRPLDTDHRHGPPYQLPYVQWQEAGVSAFVKSPHTALNNLRPGFKIVCCVGTPPSMRLYSAQGQNSWKWLNQGWVDAIFPMLYGVGPDHMVNEWRQYARAVRYPERVWPIACTYWWAKNVPTDYPSREKLLYTKHWPPPKPVSMQLHCVPLDLMWAEYEAVRDKCHITGYGFFDLDFMAYEQPDGIGEILFPKPAVPCWGKPLLEE